MLRVLIILAALCGLTFSQVIGAEYNDVIKRIELNSAKQDFSWLKTEYNSQWLKKYSYAYWINGWKKNREDKSKNLLCFETGNYGLILDIDSLDTAQFSVLSDNTNIMTTLESGTSRVALLDPATLAVELEHGGKKYWVKKCAPETALLPIKPISTMVSGMYVERYRMEKLHLLDDAGAQLECLGSLEVVAWPNSITFTAELTPEFLNKPGATPKEVGVNVADWSGATLSITLKNDKISWTNKAEFKEWKYSKMNKVSLNCNINSATPQSSDLEISFTLKDTKNEPVKTDALVEKDAKAVGVEKNAKTALVVPEIAVAQEAISYPVNFEPEQNAYVTRVPSKRGKQNMRLTGGYDEFFLEINNKSSEIKEIPFHMILDKPWSNGCSVSSILCYPDGTPTGINVQGSGTAYEGGRKVFLRPYVLIPVKPGKTVFLYRIASKYYGTVAAAYAHQDQVHEPWYGRWWQFAIGGAGETMTLDGDKGSSGGSIADVRAFYVRKGLKGATSNWTDAGHGGDWLIAYDANKAKLIYNNMKTVSLVDGPCFTDLRFNGTYGSDSSIRVDSKVSTLRTDDYSRVFFDIRYDFNKTISANNVSFFSTGSTIGVPTIAYGNLQGLIKEISGNNIKSELKSLYNLSLEGYGPYWVSTPANHRVDKKGNEKRPMGATSLIFRSVEYNLGGKITTTPTFSLRPADSNTFDKKTGKPALGLHTHLVPPPEVTEFKAGDSVHIKVTWMTPARIADDYYGPNKAFHKWLQENPMSWKTAHREAKGNNLNVKVKGGSLIQNYPLVIKAESVGEIGFDIEGGVGYVPLRFEGLASDRGYKLYQVINNVEVALDQSSCAGNDFWQTIYDASSNSYSISYNICLDEYPTSKWVLKYKKP